MTQEAAKNVSILAASVAEEAKEQLRRAERLVVEALALQESALFLIEYAEEILKVAAEHLDAVETGVADPSSGVVQNLREPEPEGPATDPRGLVE